MFELIGLKKVSSSENDWYGIVNGFYFTCKVASFGDKKTYDFYTSYSDKILIGQIVDYIENKKRENSDFIINSEVSNGILKLKFSGSENTLEIEHVLQELTDIMKTLEAKNCCSHCGSEENLAFFSHSHGISILCNQCGEKLVNQLTITKNSKGNYLKGFLGSLIGAIIGSIIWILLGTIGWVASIAGYAIGFCAFWGYKKLHGKLDKKGIIINIITIIVAFVLANYLGVYIAFRKEFGMDIITFINVTPVLFGDKEFLFSFLKEFLIGFLFLFLGVRTTISASIKQAKETFSEKIEKLEL